MKKIVIVLMTLAMFCLMSVSICMALPSELFGIKEKKILASDGTSSDVFGHSVSVSGDYAIVGAYGDGANGTDSGSAYVFERINGSWIQKAKLIASDGDSSDFFGYSVSVSGGYAIVGAYQDDDKGSNSGSAYIFERINGSWVETVKLTAGDGAPDDRFGYTVSISNDYAIVGAYWDDDNGSKSGSAYIFERINGSWVETAKLIASDGATNDNFGHSVSISGDYAIVGAYQDDDNGTDSGSVYVFERINGSWVEKNKLTAGDGGSDSDYYGYSVSIFGDYFIVGAHQDDNIGSDTGIAYIYKRMPTFDNWFLTGVLNASDGADSDWFGHSVSISNNYAIVSAWDDDNGMNSGSAYIFQQKDGSWVETAKFTASDAYAGDYFGYSVSISSDNNVIVGAYGDDDNGTISGSAYIYSLPGVITEQKILASDGASSDYFGHSVGISGNYAIIGAYYDDDNGSNSGSAYINERTDGVWTETAKLTASDGASGDLFGASVSISGNYAIIGANQDDDNGSSSGSAYIFERINGNWTETAKLTASDGATGDYFSSVSISGNYAIIGAYGDDDNGSSSGSAYIFERINGNWTETTKLTASDGVAVDFFGVRVSIFGNYAIIGAYGDDDNGSSSGSAYIFERINGNWTETAKLTASDGASGEKFGASVSISGNYAIIGAYQDNNNGTGSGSAYIFERINGNWTETTKLIASDVAYADNFGHSVTVSDNYAIVGAHEDDDNGSSSGSAYIFERINGSWVEKAKLTASDGDSYDYFGRSYVSISGNYAIIGAYGDDDNGSSSGSAYFYSWPDSGIPTGSINEVLAKDYFPLEPGMTWTHSNSTSYNTSTVLTSVEYVNGIQTRVVEDSIGRENYTSDANGISFYKDFEPDTYIEGLGVVDITVIYSPAIKMFSGSINSIGQTTNSSGTLNITYGSYGTYPLNYTSSSVIESYENVTVPFGSFKAFKVVQTLIVTGSINGNSINDTQTRTIWMAKDIGYVKYTSPTSTIVLTSTSNLPDGVDAATEDAAPNNGDGNDDGVLDSEQDNVASPLNPATGNYCTIDTTSAGTGAPLSYVTINTEADLGDDPEYDLPYGVTSFQINGLPLGGSETVRIYYHGVEDLTGYTYRKYNPFTDTWYTLPGVTYGTSIIDGQTAAYADLPLTDGGNGDADITVNSSIIDPGGPGLLECVIEGDANSDEFVNMSDILFVRDRIGESDGPADVNGDGFVNMSDILFIRDRIGNTCP